MKLQKNKKTGQLYGYLPKSIMDGMGWKEGDNIHPAIQGKDMILLRKLGKKPSPSNDRGDL